MYRLGLRVKDESVFKIVRYVIMNDNRSAKEIADACALSRETVTKVLQFFLDKSLLYKHLLPEKKVRRSYRYCINPKYNMMIFSFHNHKVYANMLTFMNKKSTKEEIAFDKKPVDPNAIIEFVDKTNEQFPLTRLQYRLGYAFNITPKETCDEINDTAMIIDTLRNKIINGSENSPLSKRFINMDSFEAAKRFFAFDNKYKSDVILYIRLNVNVIYHMIFNSDDSLSAAKTKYISNYFYEGVLPEETIAIIENAINYHGVTRVFIDSDDYHYINGFIDIVKKTAKKINSSITSKLDILETNAPTSPSVSEIGIMLRMREWFVDDIIKKLSE